MEPLFFRNQIEFRKWLEKHYQTETEVLVGYYKVQTGKPSLTWSESVDQALCFGWIDGIRRSIDQESYCIRFTPRKPDSNWSAVNIDKVERLKQEGSMTQKGLDAYEKRIVDKSKVYSFESAEKQLPDAYETAFKKSLDGWFFFNKQAPSYRKAVIHWILTAKTEKTRLSRLNQLIQTSASGKRLGRKDVRPTL